MKMKMKMIVYLLSHDFKLVLKRGINGLGDEVGLDLAPLGLESDANDDSAALLTLGHCAGREQEGVTISTATTTDKEIKRIRAELQYLEG